MSSTAATPTGPAPSSVWIVSARWDLAYIVATPLLVVPVVLVLARGWFTPEQISLAVIAFASLGHHLPGFLRAYGDRELFQRFTWRFLLAPVLVFAVALLFSPPRALSTALDLPWRHLHGLELVLLVWGTWHGLMQTYGFMRIYDVRRGRNDLLTARLDHWLCLMMFVAGVVFSDARMFGVAGAMWQAGLPTFSREWLVAARWVVGGVGLVVLATYVVHLVTMRRQGESVGWIKLLLAGITGWFYWYTGRLSTNLLIGLAMFEIYHAVQYDAIVWIYNRKLLQRAGDKFGPLGFLFRARWSMLGVYLAAIGAYSSIRYLAGGVQGPIYQAADNDAYQWLMALFVTSSTLHFYFDGFIWKVSQRSTQQNLVSDTTSTARMERLVPGLIHAGKWAVLLVIVAGLLLAERKRMSGGTDAPVQRIEALVALTPNLPECQSLASRLALERGDSTIAVEKARQAVALRPRTHSTHFDLALALQQAGEPAEAKHHLMTAISLLPNQWRYHGELGAVLAELGDLPQAEAEFRRALQLRPDSEKNIGRQLELALGATLNAAGKGEAALQPLHAACLQIPDSAEAHYQLGLAQFQTNAFGEAIQSLTTALGHDANHFEAKLQLGNTFYVLEKHDSALRTFRQCYRLQPGHANLCANLGGLLTQRGQLQEAEDVFRSGIKTNRDSAPLSYNLGILLWQQAKHDEARTLILHAEAMGMELSPTVRDAIYAP